MHRAVRKQFDGKQEEYSKLTRQTYKGTDDLARQEFKEEQDINRMLARYGVPQAIAAQRATVGEVNYDMDLQSALHQIRETREAYTRLSPELRQKYANWQQLLAAIEAGELTTLPKEGNNGDSSTTPAENQPGVSGGAASGSGNSPN